MAAAASLSLVQFYVRTFLVSLTDYSQQPDDFRRQMEMLQTATKGVPYQLSNYSSLATSTLRQDVKNAAQSGSSCYYCTCAADIVVLIDQSALICETDYENYVSRLKFLDRTMTRFQVLGGTILASSSCHVWYK